MRVLLVSTYELGRQPFGLASPAAWLRRAGFDVVCADLSRNRLDPDAVRSVGLVAVYLPMHTAARLALPVIDRIRVLNPEAHLCGYGVYAPPNAALLRDRGVSTVLGGEFEADLTALAVRLAGGGPVPPAVGGATSGTRAVPRLSFIAPDRTGLPSLARYAAVQDDGDVRRVAGYTEASRGCKHLCRHCPVVPEYHGQFRVVPFEVVLEDIRGQVAQGATHVTFGDPDFFNGITHALRVIERVAHEWPGLTYDVTIKVEHLLRHAAHLPTLSRTGCLFVTTAAESVDDSVLALLEKGHRAADFAQAVARCRDAGLALAPTFVPFTPWTTIEGYCALLRAIRDLDVIDGVAPVQLAIRLLVPEGSRLLDLPDVRRRLGAYDAAMLAYPWSHEDPRVDALQRDVQRAVGRRPNAPRRETFRAVWDLAHRAAGLAAEAIADVPMLARAAVPFMTEPWYC